MIKALLFDKDGTILDFEKTWGPVARKVAETLADRYSLTRKGVVNELLEAIGVYRDSIDAHGSMAQGTNRDIAGNFLSVIEKYTSVKDEKEFIRASTELFDELAAEAEIYPTENGLVKLFDFLHSRGFKIGLATADTEKSARDSLERLGIAGYFHFVGADNGRWAPKPDPEMFEMFCREFSLAPEEVAMIGDTPTDLLFGKQAGAGCLIGVLCGTGTRKELEQYTDVLIGRVSDIIDDEGMYIWEKRGE